jgi:peptidoglycan/LPS O-acetylase OafA/YrhL
MQYRTGIWIGRLLAARKDGFLIGIPTEFLRKFEVEYHGNNPIYPMEGFRGYAVFWVFWAHYFGLMQPWMVGSGWTPTIASTLVGLGHPAVDMFFIISGYLIYGSLITKKRSLPKYLLRRVQRIYPTFLAVFALYLILSILFPSENKIPTEFGPAAVYIAQNLLLMPGIFDIDPMIVVSWSLSYEMFFYLVLPLFIAVFALRTRSKKARILIISSFSLLYFAYCLLWGWHMRLLMFLAGMLLYETINERTAARVDRAALYVLCVGLVLDLISQEAGVGGPIRILILWGTFSIVSLAAFGTQGITAKVLSWNPARWFGNMSYSYYLFHGVTLKGLFLVFPLFASPGSLGGWVFWALMPVFFTITVITSAGLFLLVERPMSVVRSPPKAKPAAAEPVPSLSHQ